MSVKDWKNKELNLLLNEKWGFSMNLNKLNENKKPDFPDVDGDGDREEPISQAQKDKKEKDGDDKPKKKAKKGEIPPQLRKHVEKKQKDSKVEMKEANEEMSVGQRLQQVTAIRDALRQGIKNDTGINIPSEKMAGIIDMVIDAAAKDPASRAIGQKKFSKVPPKGGGQNSGGQGGAPAQVQEKLNKKKK